MAGTVYQVVTSGACLGNPGPGGWAAIVLDQEDVTPETPIAAAFQGCSGMLTSARADLLGAVAALKWIAAQHPDRASVNVYSDSSILIDGMTEWLPRWKAHSFIGADGQPVLHADAWWELAHLSAQLGSVQWRWTGHEGRRHFLGGLLRQRAASCAREIADTEGYDWREPSKLDCEPRPRRNGTVLPFRRRG